MKYLLTGIIAVVFSYFQLNAQKTKGVYKEIGLFAGGANYKGDLAPNIIAKTTGPAIGLVYKWNLNDFVAFGLHGTFGVITAADSNTEHLKPRNLSFRSSVIEFSPQFEFNFFRFGNKPNAKKMTPYLFTGLSIFYFNPMAKLNDEWHALQPLSTEGQGIVEFAPKPYTLYQLAIPIGAGMKFRIAERWNILVNTGFRTTFTDYLDDVSGTYVSGDSLSPLGERLADRSGEISGSNIGREGHQRGNPDTKDWYIFGGVTISHILDQGPCFSF
ncbi:MAG: DUF6089 family protein [Bacteroidota bacterium]|nr:DUF6089 family protein [Bacteroidota bacterium]